MNDSIVILLQGGLFLIALITLVIKLIELATQKHS
ncbi:putative holin-like toxin [Clostridium manihotivorum]|nr:putative holin-like toxin [Clostridium manihotivorum]